MADATGGAKSRGPQAVGLALRECREAFGRSLAEVAEATSIRVSYLEALETGDYDAFPGEFWARLFLRSYAQQLGLPPDETIARAFGDGPEAGPQRPARPPLELDDEPPARAARAVDAAQYRPRARGRGRVTDAPARHAVERLSALGPRSSRRRWASPVLAVLATVVVLALLAGIVYNFVHSSAPTSGRSTGAASGTVTGQASGAAGGAGSTSTSTSTATSASGGSHAKTKPPSTSSASGGGGGYTTVSIDKSTAQATYRVASRPIRLQLNFRGRCWIGIQIAATGVTVVSQVYQAGQSMTFTSARAVIVDVGSSHLASGTLNGVKFGPWPTGRPWLLTLQP